MKRLLTATILLCLLIAPVMASTNTTAYDSYLVMLLHNNQTPGSPNNFYDDATGKTVTRVGDTTTSTTTKQLGNASGYFDGTTDYLSLADSNDWYFASGNFTMSFWVRFSSSSPTGAVLINQADSSTTSQRNFQLSYFSPNLDFGYYNGSAWNDITWAWSPSTSTWYQVSIIRSGNTLTAYVDGVSLGDKTLTSSLPDSSLALKVGGYDLYPQYDFSGYLDEVVIWKGVAVPITSLYPMPYEVRSPGEIGTIGANFTANNTLGYDYPLAVQFYDNSTGSPTTWNWSYGDGRWTNGTTQNPLYQYAVAGLYNVTLVANNTASSNTTVKTNFINLTSDDSIYLKSWNHFDGANGATSIVDQKGAAWTLSSGAQLSTAQYKFGNASLLLNSNNAIATSASSAAWTVGSGAYEYEFWIYPMTTVTGKRVISHGVAATSGWGIYNTNGTAGGYVAWHGTNTTPAFYLAPNQWQHVVVSRNTTKYLSVAVDGTWKVSALAGATSDPAVALQIGDTVGGAQNTFYMDEERLTVGTKRFPSTVTFTTPYAAYRGNLYQSYVNINPNATLRYKTNPSDPPTSYAYNQTGVRNRTVQIQNITNATSISVAINYDSTNVTASTVYANKTVYSDMQVTGVVVNNALGEIEFTASRTGGGGITALFDNRTDLADIPMLYSKYSTDPYYSTYFTYGNLTDGQHNVTYPIFNFILTNIGLGAWPYPIINFTANTTSPPIYRSVQFNDTSTGFPNAWAWDFGDGSTSTQQNPVHAYTSIGQFNVTLHAYQSLNGTITNTSTKIAFINTTAAPPPAPVADFTCTPATVQPGEPIACTDASLYAPTSWSWDFGDSSGSSSQNPSHVYGSLGNYTVNLTATNSEGSNTKSRTAYIHVVPLLPPTVSFTANVTSGSPPLAVAFTDTSSDLPSSYYWDFGDGNVSSLQNDVHTYEYAGVFTVNHTATNSAGTGYAQANITVATYSGFNQHDIWMTPGYVLTLNVVDSGTAVTIPSVSATDNSGQNYTSVNGTVIFTEPYGMAVVDVFADGYIGKRVSYVMDSDRTETVQLTKSSSSSTSNLNLLYPREVQFTILNTYSQPLSNMSVSAVMVTSTVDNTNWFTTLFGISSAATPVNSTLMTGYTDDSGSVSFPMIASGRYLMAFVGPQYGINKTKYVTPQQTNYIYTFESGLIYSPNVADYINGTLTATEINSSYVALQLTYSDTSSTTRSLLFYVDASNGTRLYTQVITPPTSYFTNASYAAQNLKAAGYVWGYYANSSQFANVSDSEGILMKGPTGRLMNLDPCGGYATGWGSEC